MSNKKTTPVQVTLTQSLADAINREVWSFGLISEAALRRLPRFKEGDEVLIQLQP